MSGKRKKAGGEDRPRGRRLSPRDLLREALSEISEGKHEVDRRYPSKQRHVDDYREVIVDGADQAPVSEALMRLTEEAHRNRDRLLPEERRSVKLPADIVKNQGGHGEAQRVAEKAAEEFRDNLRRRGARERTHYYPATERQQTGEVDRTYRVPPPKGKRPGRHSR